jgi:hypothetical protein
VLQKSSSHPLPTYSRGFGFNAAVSLAAMAVTVVPRAGVCLSVTSGDAAHWVGSGFHSRPCRMPDNASTCRR